VAQEISLLIPEFRQKVIALLDACKKRNVQMEVITTIITPLEQASYWRNGRSATDAELKMKALQNASASYLAECMRNAKAQTTNRNTDTLPGCSWHNWGEAVLCVWVDAMHKVNWSPTQRQTKYYINGYQIFAEEAIKLGLTHGSTIGSFDKNWAHVQFRKEASPTDLYTLPQIDAEMKKRYYR
jgi:hypothetical protein